MKVQQDDQMTIIDIDDSLRMLIGICNKLCSLLIKENKMLTSGKMSGLYEIIPQKKELMERIAAIEDKITSQPEIIDTANKKIISETKDVYNKLNALMIETQANLEIGMRVSKSLIDFLTTHVSEKRKQELGYDHDGKMPSQRKMAQHMPPISLTSTT